MAGLDLACPGHPRSVSAICESTPSLCHFINDLIALFSVPVDGRVKPVRAGHDGEAPAACGRALESLLHRASDLPDALFDQRRRLADVSDGLTAIVEDAEVP